MKRMLVLLAMLAIATSASANLLSNGSFENGMTSWTFGNGGWGDHPQFASGGFGVFTPGSIPDGTKVAGVSYGGNLSINGWIYQTIPTVVGTQYTLTGQYAGGVGGAQALPGSGWSAWWEIGLFPGAYSSATVDGGTGSVSKVEYGNNSAAYSFGWAPVNTMFTAANTSTTVYIKYGVYGGNWNYFAMYADK